VEERHAFTLIGATTENPASSVNQGVGESARAFSGCKPSGGGLNWGSCWRALADRAGVRAIVRALEQPPPAHLAGCGSGDARSLLSMPCELAVRPPNRPPTG